MELKIDTGIFIITVERSYMHLMADCYCYVLLLCRWFAEYFKDFPVFHNGKTFPMKKKLFESLPDAGKYGKGARILEIGAGPGRLLQLAAIYI